MEWILFLILLLALGWWTKRQNGKHFKQLAEQVKKEHEKKATNDTSHDSLGVALIGSEFLGEDEPKRKP